MIDSIVGHHKEIEVLNIYHAIRIIRQHVFSQINKTNHFKQFV